MTLQKNNIVYELTDQTQIDAFISKGWGAVPKNIQHLEHSSGINYNKAHKPDYSSMTDEQLAEIATEKGFDLNKIKTRTQLIKALEK